jgi:hypothetical protein
MSNTEGNSHHPGGALGTLLKLRWAVVVVFIALLAYLGVSQFCRGIRDSQQQAIDAAEALGDAALEVADRLHTGNITTRFIAAIPRLVSDESSLLELAAFEATETFTRSDERRVLWDTFSLGVNITEIRVPVTYRYHIRLNDEWKLSTSEGLCVVRAPAIRATLPPAIHTHRMEKNSQRGWLRFDTDEQMDELERSMTPTLNERASDPDHLNLVREQSRRRVAEFVRTWLLDERHWQQDRLSAIVVVFADEPEPDSGLQIPTLVLGSESDFDR